MLPEKSNLSVGKYNVFALCRRQFQFEIGHLGLDLALPLPLLHLLGLDVHQALLLAQRQEQVTKFRLDLAEIQKGSIDNGLLTDKVFMYWFYDITLLRSHMVEPSA